MGGSTVTPEAAEFRLSCVRSSEKLEAFFWSCLQNALRLPTTKPLKSGGANPEKSLGLLDLNSGCFQKRFIEEHLSICMREDIEFLMADGHDGHPHKTTQTLVLVSKNNRGAQAISSN